MNTYADKKQRHSPDSGARKAAPAPAVSSLDQLRLDAAARSGEQSARPVDLPGALRSRMEESFGADLSAVRLYESQAVSDAGASAVAQGSSIVFAPGKVDFTSQRGQRLLGHELSHVVSQSRGEVSGSGFLNDRALEARADREGALAAAGGQVYTGQPAASLSSASAAPANGPIQAADKKNDKENISRVTPGAISHLDENGITEFKPGLGRTCGGVPSVTQHTSVAKVKTDADTDAVIKMGTNAEAEQTLAALYNTGSEVYDANHRGTWSFDAPAARALSDEEKRGAVGNHIRSGRLHSRAQNALENMTADEEDKYEMEHAAVFSLVGGEEAADKNGYTKQHQDFINSGDAEGVADYRRTLGYTSVLDTLTGNGDRITSLVNPENWKEDMEKRQIHLIDNDYWQDAPALSNAGRGSGEWLNSFLKYFTSTDTNGAATFSTQYFADSTKGRYSDPNDQALFETTQNGATTKGINQAFEDLPEIRKRLEQSIRKRNQGQPMNTSDTEMLERLRVAEEASSDPAMFQLYTQVNAARDNKALHAQLLQQRDALREKKAYGGQTHGAKPTAASGTDAAGQAWTRGTAADWLASGASGYGGQTRGARPAAASGTDAAGNKWTRGTAADWLASGSQPEKKKRSLFHRRKK